MIDFVFVSTSYTATHRGRILKLVPCENCRTEYIYVLEREATGTGTSFYFLNESGAEAHAGSAAEESLSDYLANDFDPIPCPVCGHYQKFMHSKLFDTHSPWWLVVKVGSLAVGAFFAVISLLSILNYIESPNDRDVGRMGFGVLFLLVASLIGAALSATESRRLRDFDPDLEDFESRIQKGRARAITRVEFETLQRSE